MAQNDISLGLAGAEILLPAAGRKYTRNPIEIAREDRTASGRKVKDVVVLKYGFTLQYDLITSADVRILEQIYAFQSELSLKIQTVHGVESYTVLMKPFSQERVTCIGAGLWGNVTIEMEQV